jgi:hypothetical protein
MADDPVADLYGLPLEEFVSARDALARELRKAKRRDEAAEVAALVKPSRPAWMVNQLARREGALTAKLLECAEALAEAQEAALSGGGADDLRAAARAERSAIDRLVDAARGLRPEGQAPSAAMLERLRTTLQAVASDEALRESVRAGRLADEPAGGGAWPIAGFVTAEPAPRRGRGRREPAREARDDGRGAQQGDAAPRGRAGRGPERDDEAPAAPRARPAAPKDDGAGAPDGGGATTRRSRRAAPDDDGAAARQHAAGAAEQRAERERAAAEERAERERAAAERAERRRELQDALAAARRVARDAARDRDRARRDADRATERLERLAAEVRAAEEAAAAAAARRDETEAAADDAEAEVARLEGELRGV